MSALLSELIGTNYSLERKRILEFIRGLVMERFTVGALNYGFGN